MDPSSSLSTQPKTNDDNNDNTHDLSLIDNGDDQSTVINNHRNECFPANNRSKHQDDGVDICNNDGDMNATNVAISNSNRTSSFRSSLTVRPSPIEILIHRAQNVLPPVDDEQVVDNDDRYDERNEDGSKNRKQTSPVYDVDLRTMGDEFENDDGDDFVRRIYHRSGDGDKTGNRKGKRREKRKWNNWHSDSGRVHDSSVKFWDYMVHDGNAVAVVVDDDDDDTVDHDDDEEWDMFEDDDRLSLRKDKRQRGKLTKPTIPFLDTFFKTISSRIGGSGSSSSGSHEEVNQSTAVEGTSNVHVPMATSVHSIGHHHHRRRRRRRHGTNTVSGSVENLSPVPSPLVSPTISSSTAEDLYAPSPIVEPLQDNGFEQRRRSNSTTSTSSSTASVHSESDGSTITIAGGLTLVDTREGVFKRRIEWDKASSIIDAARSSQRHNLQSQDHDTIQGSLNTASNLSIVTISEYKEKEYVPKIDPSIYKEGQETHINDAPPDTLILIMSYLDMGDLLACGVVCRLWKKLYRVNYLWAPFLVQRFGPAALRIPNFTNAIQQRQRNGNNIAEAKESRNVAEPSVVRSDTCRNGHTARSSSSNNNNNNNKKGNNKNKVDNAGKLHIYLYYTRYKYRLKRRKMAVIHREKMRRKEELRQHYEKVLRKPQKWCERIYISFYTPLFFAMAFVSLLLYGLYLDNVISHENSESSWSSNWVMFLTVSPYLLIACPLFFVGAIAAFAADFLKILRWDSDFDSFATMIFTGNMWIVIAPWLVIVKNFLLPSDTPWRAAIAPLWVMCFMFIVLSFILHKKIDRVKFGLDQKITWALTSIINIAVTVTTGFLAGKLDGEMSGLPFTFVFLPVWIVLFVATASMCIGGFVFLSGSGWLALFFFYAPLCTAFVAPLVPFLALLGIKVDKFMPDIPYSFVLSPLLLWCAIWFFISCVFGLVVLLRRKPRETIGNRRV